LQAYFFWHLITLLQIKNIQLKGKFMKNRIKEYRKQKGISQETLSKKLNVSRQTINAIENNKYDPTLTLAFKLAHLFDTTVDELFS
jgi:putative transcriptional regulator